MPLTVSASSRLKRIVLFSVGVIVLVLVFTVAIPKFADYGEVWRAVRSISRGWQVAILLAGVANIVTYAPNWMVVLPGLSWRRSMAVTMSGTAVSNVMPVGGPIAMTMQYGMLREWGFPRRDASRAMVLTGVWNTFSNLGLPIFALGLLTIRGGRNAALMAAARIGFPLLLTGMALFVIALRSEEGARRVGRLVHRLSRPLRRFGKQDRSGSAERRLPDALVAFRSESIELIRKRWLALTVATLVGLSTVYLLFIICLRAVGVPASEITFTEAFAAWASTRLLSAIPITPGGIGIVDVGLTGALVAFGGDEPKVVGAVLLYRVLTWLPPVILGALSGLTWRKQHAKNPPSA